MIVDVKNKKTEFNDKKPRNHPRISIIILNWNGWKDTIECLESLYKIKYPNYDIIVIDNGSKDKSIEKIKEYCEGKIKVNSEFFEYSYDNKPIKLIEYERLETEDLGRIKEEIDDCYSDRKLILIKNEKNFGFSEGNNIGIRYVLKEFNSEYILLLNNDAVVDKDFLDELVKVAESDEKIGVVGPKVCHYDEPEKIESAGAKVNFWIGGFVTFGKNEMDKGQYNNAFEVDFVIGVALLAKRKIFEYIGGLDPVYFAHWEETDWCTRIKRMGYTIVCNPKANIWHKGSRSLSSYSSQRMYFILRNNIIFMRKHSKTIYLPTFVLFFILLRLPAFALGVFYNSSTKNPLRILHLAVKAVKDGVTTQIKISRYLF